MHAYCMETLHLSESEAYFRIAVARASRKHPMILSMLADGRLHSSGIERLAPHLTPDNRDELLRQATHRSKREIEKLVAELQPRPDVPSTIRKLPARPAPQLGPHPVVRAEVRQGDWELRPDGVRSPPATLISPAEVRPLAPERYKVQFTASAELREKLERLRALTPNDDLAAIIEQAVTERLERLEALREGQEAAQDACCNRHLRFDPPHPGSGPPRGARTGRWSLHICRRLRETLQSPPTTGVPSPRSPLRQRWRPPAAEHPPHVCHAQPAPRGAGVRQGVDESLPKESGYRRGRDRNGRLGLTTRRTSPTPPQPPRHRRAPADTSP